MSRNQNTPTDQACPPLLCFPTASISWSTNTVAVQLSPVILSPSTSSLPPTPRLSVSRRASHLRPLTALSPPVHPTLYGRLWAARTELSLSAHTATLMFSSTRTLARDHGQRFQHLRLHTIPG